MSSENDKTNEAVLAYLEHMRKNEEEEEKAEKKKKEKRKNIRNIICGCIIAMFVLGMIKNSKGDELKCKRPKYWKSIYVEEQQCYMNTRNFLLYINSIEIPKIKKIKKNNKEICIVTAGSWEVRKNDDLINTTNVKTIQVDHIIPFSYLRRHIDCSLTSDVFNYLDNLELADVDYNLKKSNKICQTKEQCERQFDSCIKINNDLQLNLDCKVFDK